MTKIEKILNKDFLIRLVSIESIKSFANVDTSVSKLGLASVIELKVMVIEPTTEINKLSENIYELILSEVTSYKIDFDVPDERTFEFDTNEVILERHNEAIEKYTLKFFNAYTDIKITFSDLTIFLSSKREFIDGK